MRETATPFEDPATEVTPACPWRVADVVPREYPRLRVRFQDGLEGDVIVEPSFMHGVFEPLRDPDFFARVGLVRGVVTWPGELDLAPDAMHDAIAADGHWLLS